MQLLHKLMEYSRDGFLWYPTDLHLTLIAFLINIPVQLQEFWQNSSGMMTAPLLHGKPLKCAEGKTQGAKINLYSRRAGTMLDFFFYDSSIMS